MQWGRTGPFAMNIWVKQLTDSGSLFQYILSVRNRTLTNVTDDSIFYPNQVTCRPGTHAAKDISKKHSQGAPQHRFSSAKPLELWQLCICCSR